jgi:hypothetical protein
VIDAVDGDIYGVLFAYSASLREGYIILFQDILENIADVTHASKIGLPSAENPCGVSRVVRNGTSSGDTALPIPDERHSALLQLNSFCCKGHTVVTRYMSQHSR